MIKDNWTIYAYNDTFTHTHISIKFVVLSIITDTHIDNHTCHTHTHACKQECSHKCTHKQSSQTPFAFLADKISASVNFLFVAMASAGFAGPWVFDAIYFCKKRKRFCDKF